MHDRGLWPTDTPIDRTEHELADWELLTDALVGVLGHDGLMNVDRRREIPFVNSQFPTAKAHHHVAIPRQLTRLDATQPKRS